MRDIDFYELDEAVNRFLDKKGNRKDVKIQKEVVVDIDATLKEGDKKPEKDTFVVREDKINVDTRASLIPGRIVKSDSKVEVLPKNKDEAIESKEEIKESMIEIPAGDNGETLSIKVKNHEKNYIHDNFDEKPRREHKRKHSDILDDLKTVNFEEPVLDSVEVSELNEIVLNAEEEEKIMPEIGSEHEKSISAEALIEKISKESREPSNEAGMILTDNDIAVNEKAKQTNNIPQVLPVREPIAKLDIPSRPGVKQIEEHDDLVVFGPKKQEAENNQDNILKKPQIDDSEGSSIIAVNIIENNERQADESNEAETIVETESIDSTKEVAKISIKVDEEESLIDEEMKESKIISQAVKPDNISMEEIKTPFVSNAKIEKRPLGMSQSASVSNFDIKPINRSKEIHQSKINNQQPQAPLLARDEYSAPIAPKKKKSGWKLFLLLSLLFAIIGSGIGFAVWYFYGK